MSGNASTFIIKVAPRGKDAGGLMRYLYGPGVANEHSQQHMVASSPSLLAAYPGALTNAEASELGRVVEQSWRDQVRENLALVGAEARGVSRATLSGHGEQAALLSDGDKEHVYHLIVSQPPGVEWSVEQYAMIAHDIAQGMGFSAGHDDDMGSRWIAMRHGESGNGNHHMHMVFNLVREDGQRVWFPKADFNLAQDVRRAIEQRYDFVVPLEDHKRDTTRSLPAYTMHEHRNAQKRAELTGQEVPDRVVLQQLVRGAATTSPTEVEFMHAVLDAHPNMELEPARWATSEAGERSVTGYKVRLGEDGTWFTASQLAPDLTLGELRPGWAMNETPDTIAAARSLWAGEAEPAPYLEVDGATARQHLNAAVAELESFNRHIATLEPADREAWSKTLSDTAGAVSWLSTTPGPIGEDISIMGTQLARTHLNQPGTPRVHVPVMNSGPSRAQLAARHVQLAMRASDPRTDRGWIAVLTQMGRTLDAVRDAARARGELAAARALHTNGADIMHAVTAQLERQHNTGGSARPDANFHSLGERERQRAISAAIREGRSTAPATDATVARRDTNQQTGLERGHGRSM